MGKLYYYSFYNKNKINYLGYAIGTSKKDAWESLKLLRPGRTKKVDYKDIKFERTPVLK